MLEPLHPELWRRRLKAIITSIAILPEGKDPACLRRLYHLLALTPMPLRQWFFPRLPEDMFERLLLQSRQTAAFSLIGESFDFAVTAGRQGEGAAITLRLDNVEVEACDSSLARAIARAICEIGLRLSAP